MTAPDRLTADIASVFMRIALGHVTRPYPHKLDHVWLSDADATTPRQQHPIFFGSFDWHSCVHSYWTLARCLRRFPNAPEASRVIALFNDAFTAAKVTAECDYALRPLARGFERPYGWAWLLMLWSELARAPTTPTWAQALKPLADVFARKFKDYLPLAIYPVRAGTHGNTAFAAALALKYCDMAHDRPLRVLLIDKLKSWYGADIDCQAWEPSGDDFLSPALVECEAMRRALTGAEFANWLARFLPRLTQRQPQTLFVPATVSDRTDGKIAHLDGLNLSRAWCWWGIAASNVHADVRAIAAEAAATHLQSAMNHITGDFMGEHWLASFALLALEATD